MLFYETEYYFGEFLSIQALFTLHFIHFSSTVMGLIQYLCVFLYKFTTCFSYIGYVIMAPRVGSCVFLDGISEYLWAIPIEDYTNQNEPLCAIDRTCISIIKVCTNGSAICNI